MPLFTYASPVSAPSTNAGGKQRWDPVTRRWITDPAGPLPRYKTLPARIPGQAGLEETSSARINELLNPPALFPDTSRMAAETSAGRGIAGSPAAASTAVRLTDEERLKRIALGEQLFTGAVNRYTLPPEVPF